MSAHTTQRRLARAGDAELIRLTRKGDSDAYAALFRRHASAAAAVARSVTSTFESDDLVSEAYTRVLNALRAGNGPTAAFRPYLFTTVRNVAASWGRSAGNNTVSLDPDELDELAFGEDDSLAALDRSLTAKAFRSLPTRWQEALWYSEVEGMPPAGIAPLLGLSAQATAALCYRAREGLRQAWIRAHLTSADLAPECAWTVDRLAAHARGRLSKRERTRVDDHLETCAACTLVAEEARDVGDRLVLVLLPIAIGAAGAAAYAATLHAGAVGATAGVAAAGAGTTASGTAGGSAGTAGASGTSGGVFSGTSGIIVGVATAVVVVGCAIAAFAIATAPAAHSDTAASSNDDPAKPSAPAPKPPETSAPAPSRPPAAPPPAPVPVSVPAPDVAAVPSPPTTPTVPVTPTGPGTPTDPGTPPVTDPPPPVAPAAPSLAVDTGDGRYLPLVSGIAEPGATVTVTGAGSTFTVLADANGAWSVDTAIAGYAAGAGTVSATQTDTAGLTSPATTTSFTLNAPQASARSILGSNGPIVRLTTTGAPNSSVEVLVDGTSRKTITLDGSGRNVSFVIVVARGTHDVELRYVDAAGRVGTGIHTPVTLHG